MSLVSYFFARCRSHGSKRSSHVEILITLFSTLGLLVPRRRYFSKHSSSLWRLVCHSDGRRDSFRRENYGRSSEMFVCYLSMVPCTRISMFSSRGSRKAMFVDVPTNIYAKRHKQFFGSPKNERNFSENCWFCLQFLYAITITLYGTQLYHKNENFLLFILRNSFLQTVYSYVAKKSNKVALWQPNRRKKNSEKSSHFATVKLQCATVKVKGRLIGRLCFYPQRKCAWNRRLSQLF